MTCMYHVGCGVDGGIVEVVEIRETSYLVVGANIIGTFLVRGANINAFTSPCIESTGVGDIAISDDVVMAIELHVNSFLANSVN